MRRILLPLLLLPLSAQGQIIDDDELYIPPTLTVGIDSSLSSRREVLITNRYWPLELPLLPVLFFDAPGAVDIPARYHRFTNPGETREYDDTAAVLPEAAGWTGIALRYPEHAKYYELLDIIGDRMRANPGTTVALRGGYSAEPGESPEVADMRAESVRAYLTEIWGIETNRITIATPRREAEPSADRFRQEEARHVMFETDSWMLLRPVTFRMIARRDEPATFSLLITPNVASGRVATIEVVAQTDRGPSGRDTIAWKGEWVRADLRGSWDWTGVKRRDAPQTLSLQAVIGTADGRSYVTTAASIPVVWERVDMELPADEREIYLPFYYYRTARIGAVEQRMLREYAAQGWSVDATYTTGLSDITEDIDVVPERVEGIYREWYGSSPENAVSFDGGAEPGKLTIVDTSEKRSLWEFDWVCNSFIGPPPRGYHERAQWVETLKATPWALDNVESIVNHRTESVNRYLRDSLGFRVVAPTDGDEPSWIDFDSGYDKFSYPFEPLPELRCYARGAMVMLRRGG